MHWTDFWIAECLEFFICSLTENFPILTLTGPCRKAKITEIRSFLTPVTAKSNSTILHHDTRENKLQRTLKKNPGIPDLSNVHGFPCSVCFHYLRRIPLSLGSVLEFCNQSLTLKYIEIGLFDLSFLPENAEILMFGTLFEWGHSLLDLKVSVPFWVTKLKLLISYSLWVRAFCQILTFLCHFEWPH